MAESRALAARFEEHRGQLLRMAYRLLGTLREADVVVDHAWRELTREGARDLDDLHGLHGLHRLQAWLIATVARSCLDIQRAQRSRRDRPPGARLPDPTITPLDRSASARDLGDTDEVSLALLVVLETLTPAERLVYVLHDMFAVPCEQIAAILERTPTATRQLQRRARSRVAGASRLLGETARITRAPRRTVEAFLVAARKGDFDALLTVLDPDVVLRTDRGAAPMGGATELRGAGLVAKQTLTFSKLTERAQLVTVNGGPGVLTWLPGGQPFAVLGFTLIHDKIMELYVFVDPERLLRLDLTLLTRA